MKKEMSLTESNSGKSSEITRRRFLWLSAVSAAGWAVGCAVNPVTGKNQLMLVSENQEIQIDRQHSPMQFSSDYGLTQDRALAAYVHEVGRRLVPHVHRPNMPYNFRMVNAVYINAYAFPGGSIAATRGILLKLKNEAELAALLGHELGHVNARHTAEQMSKSQVMSIGVTALTAFVGAKYSQYSDIAGQIGQIGAGMLLASYSRDNERQADDLGNHYMVKAGYGTQGFVGLMEMLNNMSKHQTGSVAVLFSTHPMSNERYQTALSNAQSKYANTRNMPLNRDRYMDRIASLRRMEKAVDAMQKGEAEMNGKKFSSAQSRFKTALKIAPGDYAGLALMAKCLLVQKKYKEAESFAEKAKKAYPQEAQGYHLAGFAKLNRKKYDAAYQEFSACDRMLPGNPAVTFFKGYAQEGMKHKPQAAQEYQKYLQAVREGDYAKHAHQRLKEWGYIQSK